MPRGVAKRRWKEPKRLEVEEKPPKFSYFSYFKTFRNHLFPEKFLMFDFREHSGIHTSSKVDMKSELVPRNETSKERALSPTPTTTKSLKFEGDGFMSLCSPAGTYKEERYWCQEIGFKIVDFGDADIQPDSVVAGGMPLRVLLLDI